MMKPILFILLLLLSACASTDRVYFANVPENKPHAILHIEQKNIGRINLFGITVAAITPLSINGLPVDAQKENWKMHAFGEFAIPVGDTMVTFNYSDRDNRAIAFVRFNARSKETYFITHRIDNTFIHFDVLDKQERNITTTTFRKWQYVWLQTPEEIALLKSAHNGSLEQVKALLKQGVNPNWSAAYKQFKPITVAAANGHLDIVAALIQAGADMNPINQITPLEAACMRGHTQVVALLLKHGVYVDLGISLIYAAEHGHIAIVRLLLARNAYLLSRNSEGLTAFELAQRNGHASIAQLLQTYRMEPK